MSYFYVLLLRLVAFLEGTNKILLFTLVLIIFSTSIFIKFYNHRKNGKYLFEVSIYSLFILVFVFIHTLIFSKLTLRDSAVLITYYIWFVYLLYKFWDKSINESLRFILFSFLIYNIANYVLDVMFFANAKAGINSIMAMFGLKGYRVYFPLSSGANINASQIGLSALIGIYFFKNAQNSLYKLGYLLINIFLFYLLILSDSRMVLLITSLFSVLILFSINTIFTFIRKHWLLLSLLLIGFLYIFYTTKIFEGFKRGGEKTGSAINRFKIWQIAGKIIFEDLRIFTGHGLNGLERGMTSKISKLFSKQHLQTSHNFMIQTVVDFGVFGLLTLIYFIKILIVKSIKLKETILIYLIIATLIFGTTESIPTFYSFEATLYFLGLISIIITKYERKFN